LVRNLPAGHLLADRAFDADWLRNDLVKRGIIPVMLLKSNRKFLATFDKETYKWRHLIENCFGKLEENRGIAMRSCKTDQSFKAFISIAATIIQIR
jgi:transposase